MTDATPIAPYTDAFFDTPIDRRGTNCNKWDSMEAEYGVSPDDGIAMWVADMDFQAPRAVQLALMDYARRGVFGYDAGRRHMHERVAWWMAERHGWTLDPAHIVDVHGLVNGIGLCLDTFTEPGDGVVVFSPVYHSFYRAIRQSGRVVVECPLVQEGGRYRFDFERYDAQMTGRETALILCSPHNPGGTVWSKAELEEVAAFARRHDLLLMSDEIHCDLVYPGAPKHIPMALIEGVADRLVMMTSTTKTFNVAGIRVGQATIADDRLRERLKARMNALSLRVGAIGPLMIEAAYTPDGADWLDALMRYLDGNRARFDACIAEIPGLISMPLDATYLSWVDFERTGLSFDEMRARVEGTARIAANHGHTFGMGGERFLRFNIATTRANIETAVDRLRSAFGDLQ